MFGPFTPEDSLSVYRLQRKGVSLDLPRDCMRPNKPLWEAWVAFLSQHAMGRPTFSLNDPYDGQAFIQVRYRPHQAAADVVYLAPALAEHRQAPRAWRRLLDGACIEAAGQGIQRVFASLPLSGEEVEVFQQTGFTVYAREDIYRREHQGVRTPVPPLPTLRHQRADDWPAIQKLCVSITPQQVRQAEGGILLTAQGERNCLRYVVSDRKGDSLVATLMVCPGGQAHWLRLLVHPSTQHEPEEDADPAAAALRGQSQLGAQAGPRQEDASTASHGQAGVLAHSLIQYGLSKLSSEAGKPVYCNLRLYESGVRHALQTSGFELCNQRVLTVKHTVAWSKTPAQDAIPVLKRSAEPVGPTYRINGEPDAPSQEGRLVSETRAD